MPCIGNRNTANC